MAFFKRGGSILRQTLINDKISIASSTVRCMSNWKVFVGGIGPDTDATRLIKVFSKHGEVTKAQVIKDKKSGKSRGFGFVTFADYESGCDAIETIDQWELDGETVTVRWAKDSCGFVHGVEVISCYPPGDNNAGRIKPTTS